MNSAMTKRRCRCLCIAREAQIRAQVVDLGRGGDRSGIGAVGLALGGVDIIVSLVGAINSDLDCDLTALDLFAIHLRDGLLLELLRGQSDEAEATTLASLATSLELLDHEAGDGAKGDLGGDGLVGIKEFLKLRIVSSR